MDMKTLRQKSGLKAEEVAVRVGIGVSTIRNWEQGRTIPKLRIDQFTELCKLYRCNIEDLNEAAQGSIRLGDGAGDRSLTATGGAR